MRILITAALPYVNNVPHIGNIVGSHLPADIFARFCRLMGYETIFIGGSDEHGTPIEVTARKLGIPPKKLCDVFYKIHKDIYDWFNFSYDNFSRTSRDIHHEMTKKFFMKMYERGYIIEGYLNLPYCENDKMFLPDRYVYGKCPKCGYELARGDQCEKCGTLLNPEDLIDPKCSICNNKPVFKKVKHLFFDLRKLQKDLEEWIKSKENIWYDHVVNLSLSMIKHGLKPRCISRDLKWGVKIPLKGYEDKVFYVWFDAPIGYISSTVEYFKKIGKENYWEKYWKDKDTRIYHFIGKDNIPFHTIFWPAMLMANGEYILPYFVVGLHYLNYEGDKISKTRQWGIFCENLPKSGLDSDIWRYYLTHLIPENSDTEWKWKEFKERINNELVANIGNFIYRVLSFIKRYFNGKIPEYEIERSDEEFLNEIRLRVKEYIDLMHKVRIRDSLKKVLEISYLCNKYFQENEPWKLIEKNPKRAGTVIFICANLCFYLALLLHPFLPKSSEKICKILNKNIKGFEQINEFCLKPGDEIKEPEILFPKITDEMIENLKKTVTKPINFEDLFYIEAKDLEKLNLKLCEIIYVEKMDENRTLIRVKIDDEIKECIVKVRNAEKLLGKLVLCNNEGIFMAEDSLITVDGKISKNARIR